MSKNLNQGGSSRLRLVSIIVFIALMGGAVVTRAANNALSLTLLEIGIAVAFVGFILFLFDRKLGSTTQLLEDIRKDYPVAYICYFENDQRGIVAVKDGELKTWHIRWKKAKEGPHYSRGTWTVDPSKMQLTATRKVDGAMISNNELKYIRVALSHDHMTLLGNLLKGPDLDDAIQKLQQASK